MLIDNEGRPLLRKKPKGRDPGIKAKTLNKAVKMPVVSQSRSLSEVAWAQMRSGKPEQSQSEFMKLPKKKQRAIQEQAEKTHKAIMKRLGQT